ncbi:hypothetical protein ACN268_11350 [Micromonospora sp. WMMD735]|uniref:hypothetical protein n=1 Tax=Micromonospora sp. WMMD735 TaxID=3404130 RepID=UPI003B9600A3
MEGRTFALTSGTVTTGRLRVVAGIGAMAILLIGPLLVPGQAVAAPTPVPASPVVPCPAPEGGQPGGPREAETLPQVGWCLPWARWQAGDGWVTTCSTATTVVDQERCDAVSMTVQSPPPDGTPSVLDEVIPASGEQPVRCERFTARATEDEANAVRWLAKRDRCESLRTSLLPYSSLQATQGCQVLDVACQVGTQVKGAARSGFEGLADVAVAGFAWALGKLAEIVFEQSTTTVDEPFYGVYNDISGVLIVMVLLVFVISTAINGLRIGGPGPLSTLGGLVRAMFGIAFAGGIAYLLMAAWDEATIALIDRNQQRDWQPGVWVDALTALTLDTGTVLLAFLVAVIGVIGLVLVFVMLLFRSLLAAGAALFGAMAMTGQVMAETRSWGRKWFWTCNALASSKFFIAALWIYGTRTAYESDNVLNVLRGLFIIVLMVLAPWILLRLTSMWDGYLADVDARGFLTSTAAAVGVDAAARRLSDPLSGGSGDVDAASLMQGNSDAIPTSPGDGSGLLGKSAGTTVEAVAAMHGSGDSDQFGEPATDVAADRSGGENAEEADGVERDARTAQGDMVQGQLTLPGDTTGQQGALPLTPQAPPSGPAMATGAGGDGAPAEGGSPTGNPVGAPSPADPALPPETDPDAAGAPGSAGGEPAGGAGGSGGAGGAAAAGGAAEIPIVPV